MPSAELLDPISFIQVCFFHATSPTMPPCTKGPNFSGRRIPCHPLLPRVLVTVPSGVLFLRSGAADGAEEGGTMNNSTPQSCPLSRSLCRVANSAFCCRTIVSVCLSHPKAEQLKWPSSLRALILQPISELVFSYIWSLAFLLEREKSAQPFRK